MNHFCISDSGEESVKVYYKRGRDKDRSGETEQDEEKIDKRRGFMLH